MTTEHTEVRSGKSKRKPFNSNVADYLLIIATFAFSYPLVGERSHAVSRLGTLSNIGRDAATNCARHERLPIYRAMERRFWAMARA